MQLQCPSFRASALVPHHPWPSSRATDPVPQLLYPSSHSPTPAWVRKWCPRPLTGEQPISGVDRWQLNADSAPNATADGATNATADGAANATADDYANATADGAANANADDYANATADGAVNATADGAAGTRLILMEQLLQMQLMKVNSIVVDNSTVKCLHRRRLRYMHAASLKSS